MEVVVTAQANPVCAHIKQFWLNKVSRTFTTVVHVQHRFDRSIFVSVCKIRTDQPFFCHLICRDTPIPLFRQILQHEDVPPRDCTIQISLSREWDTLRAIYDRQITSLSAFIFSKLCIYPSPFHPRLLDHRKLWIPHIAHSLFSIGRKWCSWETRSTRGVTAKSFGADRGHPRWYCSVLYDQCPLMVTFLCGNSSVNECRDCRSES